MKSWENGVLHRRHRHLRRRHADRANAGSEKDRGDGQYRKGSHTCRRADARAQRPAGRRPRFVTDLPIHPGAASRDLEFRDSHVRSCGMRLYPGRRFSLLAAARSCFGSSRAASISP